VGLALIVAVCFPCFGCVVRRVFLQPRACPGRAVLVHRPSSSTTDDPLVSLLAGTSLLLLLVELLSLDF
jgi:hypothetical protein